MRVIDLLNKIANDEEVPYRIELKSGIILFYCPDTKNYYNDIGCNELFDSWISDKLNDEVKILDKDNKIEKLEEYGKWSNEKLGIDEIASNSKELLIIKQKINEIIDKLNAGVDKV